LTFSNHINEHKRTHIALSVILQGNFLWRENAWGVEGTAYFVAGHKEFLKISSYANGK
jgi:hypothetical protein